MDTLKKLSTFVAAMVLASACYAANLPMVSGVLEAGQPSANANLVLQAVNAGVDGLLGSTVASVTTTLTTIQTLGSYTVNGGVLATAGQGLHVHAWGVNSADANAKTVTLAFGSTNLALAVTGSANIWSVDCYALKTGASTQTLECQGVTGTTVVAPVAATSTQTDTAAISVLLQGTAATAGTVTLSGGYIEQIK